MTDRISVSILAIPDAIVSTITGLYDVLNGFDALSGLSDAVPAEVPFDVSIVAASSGPADTASGLPLIPHRTLAETTESDIVVVPSLLVRNGRWEPGRYPEVVEWLIAMHDTGALLCSACSGVLLLAETNLLNGLDATVHWAYADTFRQNYPSIKLRLEEVLVVTGDNREFAMSGASASWHDLVLYLIARLVGPTAAQAIANFMLLQWHTDGQAPYMAFAPPTDHGDGVVLEVQRWLEDEYDTQHAVREMVALSGLAERTFKRRFAKATGLTPISYVQQLRIEHAKRLLERTDLSTDRVCFEVGYAEPASFRRLFKRITHLTPAEYRRRIRVPAVLPNP